MNPAYAGRLSDSITGGVADIQAGYQQRRAREAKESMTQIMLNGDLSDPRVQNSMTAVASQMGQDPTIATDMIEQGQAAQRREEDQAQQKAAFKMQVAKHDYTMKTAKEADELKKATAVAAARISKQPEKMEEIIAGLPVEQQSAVRTAVIEKMEFETSVMQYNEEAKGKTTFSTETLEAMAETEGMADPLAVYEKMKTQYPQGAKKLLLKQYEAVRQNEMMIGRSTAQRNKPLTSTETKNAMAYVDKVFDRSKTLGSMFSGAMPWNDATPDPEALKAAVAKRLAYKKRDPEYDPTPEAVDQIFIDVAREHMPSVLSEEERAPAQAGPALTGQTGTVADGRTVSEGKDGSWYYDDGSKYEE
jgi:hypothetical protein